MLSTMYQTLPSELDDIIGGPWANATPEDAVGRSSSVVSTTFEVYRLSSKVSVVETAILFRFTLPHL